MRTNIMRFGRRPILSLITAVVALTAVQSAAFAHFIWATVEKGQVRFALLENVSEAPSAQFEKYVANLTPHSGNKTLTLGEIKEGARFAPVPAGQGIITAESVIGAKEREGKSYLLIYDAKGAVSLSAAKTLTKAPAELLARKDGKELVISLRANGNAVPQTEVWTQWPGVEEASVKTDDKGDVRVPWSPEGTHGGFVGIRAMVIEDKAGEEAGKSYASIHRWATLSFPLDGPKVEAPKAKPATTTAAVTENKPLTQQLREAYGGNHERAGNAAFNQTLFAGKLTRAQLETHLQQRALVHSEVHRILNAAAKESHIPYGAEQKNVLVLLFSDLINMGSEWPSEAQARPLTRDFLKEIRDSEKQGPYFALGVYHVYYGGITNGGRMIGQKIGDTLQFLPAYYEKSDGYIAYLPEVNKITDPAAQQEMIRGGKAAYKYIIEISNEDVFKSDTAQNRQARK